MKYSNLTWGLLAVMAVLMVAAFGQNMGLFSLVAPSGYVWNDNDVLDDVGNSVAVFPTHVYKTLYSNDFHTDDDMIRVSSVGSAGWGGNRYVYGEYLIIITDGIVHAESDRFGSTGNEVVWYVDIQNFNKDNLEIIVNGKKAQYGYDYINGLRGGTCSGDCRSHDLRISSIGISSNKNEPPVVDYSINPSPVVEDEGSIFDASESYSPLNSPLTYSWNMGDGTLLTGDVLTHTYDTAGSYVVTLIIDDGLMSSTKRDIIKVERFGYMPLPPQSEPPVDDIPPASESPVDDRPIVVSNTLIILMVLGIVVVTVAYIKKREQR